MNPRKYPLLWDKEWLFHKYFQEQMSMTAIANLVGAKNCNSVRMALKFFGVTSRNPREAQTLGREDDGFIVNADVLLGSLLGDASLVKWKKTSKNCAAYFQKKNKFRDHIAFVSSFLFSKPFEDRIKPVTEKYIYNGVKKELVYYYITSLTHGELNPFYNEWYPRENNYMKVVARSLIFTPRMLLHWFLDDGCCLYSRKTATKWYPRVIFSSQGFSLEDQNFLINRLYKDLGLYGVLGKTGDGVGYRISIRQDTTKEFFDCIGECPISCMSYKWKELKELEDPSLEERSLGTIVE